MGVLLCPVPAPALHRSEVRGPYPVNAEGPLLVQGVEVFEVNRPDRTDRRLRGKSDPFDAQNAARAVLSGRAYARAKSGDGPVQIARMYKLTKGSAVKARTQAINQLKAVLITADPALREELAGLNNPDLFRACARFADDSKNEEGEVRFESAQGVSELSAPTPQRRFSRPENPVLSTSKAPHPYQQITVSYDEPGRAIVHIVSTMRL